MQKSGSADVRNSSVGFEFVNLMISLFTVNLLQLLQVWIVMGKSHSDYIDLFSSCRVHLHPKERKYASQGGRMFEANSEVMNEDSP